MEGLYNLCGENKGADQLRGYREADLRLCFRICKKPVFSQRGSNKRHIKELERNHLNALRQIQSLPKRTASLSVCMLIGVLSIEAKYSNMYKR